MFQCVATCAIKTGIWNVKRLTIEEFRRKFGSYLRPPKSFPFIAALKRLFKFQLLKLPPIHLRVYWNIFTESFTFSLNFQIHCAQILSAYNSTFKCQIFTQPKGKEKLSLFYRHKLLKVQSKENHSTTEIRVSLPSSHPQNESGDSQQKSAMAPIM